MGEVEETRRVKNQANKGGVKEKRKDESRGKEEGKGADTAYFRFGTV